MPGGGSREEERERKEGMKIGRKEEIPENGCGGTETSRVKSHSKAARKDTRLGIFKFLNWAGVYGAKGDRSRI